MWRLSLSLNKCASYSMKKINFNFSQINFKSIHSLNATIPIKKTISIYTTIKSNSFIATTNKSFGLTHIQVRGLRNFGQKHHDDKTKITDDINKPINQIQEASYTYKSESHSQSQSQSQDPTSNISKPLSTWTSRLGRYGSIAGTGYLLLG